MYVYLINGKYIISDKPMPGELIASGISRKEAEILVAKLKKENNNSSGGKNKKDKKNKKFTMQLASGKKISISLGGEKEKNDKNIEDNNLDEKLLLQKQLEDLERNK